MGIVQVAGGLLAIARDKRHSRTFIEQSDRSGDLMGTHAEFFGNEWNNLQLCRV